MLIHSIVPYEQIFENREIKPTQERPIEGGYAEITDLYGKPCISRIISTDPSVYLNKMYQPGSIYTPRKKQPGCK